MKVFFSLVNQGFYKFLKKFTRVVIARQDRVLGKQSSRKHSANGSLGWRFTPPRNDEDGVRKLAMAAVFIFFFCVQAFAVVFIDVSPFQWLPTQKGLRVFVFDVHQQCLKEVRYYFEDTAARRKETPSSWRYEDVCEIFSDGTVRLLKEIDPKDYIIRTFYKLKTAQGIFLESSCTPSYPDTYDGPTLSKLIMKVSPTRGTQKALPFCLLHKKQNTVEPRLLSHICPENLTANSQERGILGEIATELTFTAFNYERLPCQNKSNKGLDGAFFYPQQKWLFLTESKCREESKTAANYLKTELSENRIRERLNALPATAPQRKTIEAFLEEHPHQVFKLVQRLLPNGQIQSAIASFDSSLYQGQLNPEKAFWAELTKRLTENPSSFALQLVDLLKNYPEVYATLYASFNKNEMPA